MIVAEYHKVIGIDLGTTFSVVSVFSTTKNDVVVIPSPQNQRTTPSVVYIAKNGQISVGDAARRKLERDPGGVIIEAKRLMGERDETTGAKRMKSAAGREFEPEFVSAAILKELKGYAERFIGEPIHDAVITVPAYFKEPQKKATEEAARLARLNPRLLVNEPTAAAVAYGLDEDDDLTFVVYDFGGGTFDVSVVKVRNGRQFDILGTGGDSHLGGGDIDQILIDWFLGQMKAEYSRNFSGDDKLGGRVRLEAERVKIALCNSMTEQAFELDDPADDIDRVCYYISPAELKRRIQPLLEKTRREVDVAMESAGKKAGVTWDDVDAFVLVGGSSKIPFVRDMLSETYKKPIKSDLNPDEIVSIGAARLAMDYKPSQGPVFDEDKPLVIEETAELPGNVVPTDIKDVVSHTLGIGLKDDKYDALIEKDKYIPARVHRKGYTTAEDNQTSIWIPVFQGDNPKASLNYQIGEVVIPDLSPAPVGTHHFEVTFALDANGIFNGQVVHTETGAVKDIKLQRGQDALVEKRRIDLADMIEKNNVMTLPNTSAGKEDGDDRVAELVTQAQAALNRLPAAAQGDLTTALAELVLAQHSKNLQQQGQAIVRIRSILDRHSAA
ncbi:MAG: Hsp70 family protein [Rhizomicrobium sp.]